MYSRGGDGLPRYTDTPIMVAWVECSGAVPLPRVMYNVAAHTIRLNPYLITTLLNTCNPTFPHIVALTQPSAVRSVLAGRDLSGRDSAGRTVSHYAVIGGCIEAIEFCVTHGGGAMSDKTDYGETMAHCVAWGGSAAAIQYCVLNGGGAMSDKNNGGLTMIDMARKCGYPAVEAYCLVNCGGA